MKAMARPCPFLEKAHLIPQAVGRCILCMLAVSPFLSLYVHHFTPTSGVPTGFVLIDMPAYSANGRAIFERGNNVAYPNPGLMDPHAPIIYFQWFSWILGFGIVKLGFDPGIQFVVIGCLSALVLAWLTLRLVETVLPLPDYKYVLFLMVMWGGGLLCLERMYANWLADNDIDYLLFAYEPSDGWWFLNWGRNIVLPTEATYHVVVAACWLAVLKDAWFWAVVMGAAMAATHPFTGLQTLLILITWSGLCLIHRFERRVLAAFTSLAVLLGVFLGYHLVFLELFPEHWSVREQMSVAWLLPGLTMILAYGVVGFLAAARLVLDRHQLGRDAGFLIVSAAVSLLLANHELFMQPRQPIHFTRGYIWLPLCLLALPLVQRLLITLRARLRPLLFGVCVLALLGVAASDNLAFIVHCWRAPQFGIVLSEGEWNALDWMRRQKVEGTFLSSDVEVTYLASTYTKLRPFYSHWQHTPYYDRRRREAARWFGKGEKETWLPRIDYMLVEKAYRDKTLARLTRAASRGWTTVFENNELALLHRQRDTR
jgi:hypothetical protein